MLVIAALVVLVIGGLILVFVAGDQLTGPGEAETAKQLESLGALVVKDPSQSHVNSVNVSTIQSEEALAEAVQLLPKLSYIASLDASRTKITDEQLGAVGQLTSLTSLSLSETPITDDGLERLRGLSELQSLNIAVTNVSDAGLPAIAEMRDLKVVNLSGAKVSRDLSPLATLPALEWLVLRDTKLEDDALPSLSGSSSLRRLTLEGAQVTEESLAKLREQSPGLAINK